MPKNKEKKKEKNEQKKESPVYDGDKLWDEILKAIVDTMPAQLFPLFEEVYGKKYPRGTSIVLLKTETSTFLDDEEEPPGSTFMDIALLVGSTDYYHLECQMKNDHEMVIRMFAYDVHFAITHTKTVDGETGEITLEFPHSVVIYPEKNDAVPDFLQCRILFQDKSEHIYKIPTVKVQTYSLKEIKEKHLILFLPYTMLRFRPRLQRGKLVTEKELTAHLEEVILILREEVSAGNLTELQYKDYVRMVRHAADRVFANHEDLRKEADNMTKPKLWLPSMEVREMEEKVTEYKAELADKEAELARQKEKNAKQAAEIKRLKEKLRLVESK